ncbi:MAG TPA: HAMP domain-containing sensor histidine kinase [Nitrospirota bacterium]|nr:HAMP domain-containing sensor histidine kinase [Nitrospirota bacterium]
MKTSQHASVYSRKRTLRPASTDADAIASLSTSASQGMELQNFAEPPRPISPAISQATQNIGQTLYELLGMAELMRVSYEKGELAAVQNRLPLLMKEATNLASFISAVLEHTKLEKETTETAYECFDIVALFHEMSETARSLVGNKPVTVMDASCPGPIVIHADPSTIRQIVTELMDNAVRFTDRGRIALILNKDDDKIRLTVADTGKGMAPEQIKAVLESSDRRHKGEMNSITTSGLGLRIVKTLVKKLDGRISLASKSGGGTIVEVSLPLKAPL